MQRIAVLFLGILGIIGSVALVDQNCKFEEALFDRCSMVDVSEKNCKTLKCCYANEYEMKKHNFPQNCLKPVRPKYGFCTAYNGSLCEIYFRNNTNWKTHFIDQKYGINGTDMVIMEFMKVVDTSARDGYCRKILPPSLCHYAVPPCSDNGEPVPICRDDCDQLLERCKADLDKILGAVEYIVRLKGLNFTHLVVPDCSHLKYRNDFGFQDKITCRRTGLFEPRKELEKKPQKIWKYIVIGVGSGILLLVIAALVVYVKRCRTWQQKNQENSEVEFMSVYKTIRDRLRQDSAVSDHLLSVLSKMGSSPEPVQYPLDRVEYVRDLGQGQFGKVFQGRIVSKTTEDEQTMVAVKVLKEGSSNETKEAFNQEVTLMSALQHENILRLLAVSTEEEPYCMIFEFMLNGDLNNFLRENDPERKTSKVQKVVLTTTNFVDMSYQIASGMEYLSRHHFIHRDLATRNCLVGGGLEVKIADFGMSRDIYASDYYRVGGEAMLPIRWMPPEAILYGKFTIESDVFSYGILLWEIFTYALQPYYGYSNEEVVEFIKKGVLLPQPALCPDSMYEIMLGSWHRESAKRLKFAEILHRIKVNVIVDDVKSDLIQEGQSNSGPSGAVTNGFNDESACASEMENGNCNVVRNEEELAGEPDISSSFYGRASKDMHDRGLENPLFAPDGNSKSVDTESMYSVPRNNRPLSNKNFKQTVREGSDCIDTMEPRTEEVKEILNKRYISSDDAKKLNSLSGKSRSLNKKDKIVSYQSAFQPTADFWKTYLKEAKGKPLTASREELFRNILSNRSFKTGKITASKGDGVRQTSEELSPASRQRSLTSGV